MSHHAFFSTTHRPSLSHILQLSLELGRLMGLISALPASSLCPALNRNSPSCDRYFNSWSMIAPLRKARKQVMGRNERWGEPALCIEKSISPSLLLECRRWRTMRGMATVILCSATCLSWFMHYLYTSHLKTAGPGRPRDLLKATQLVSSGANIQIQVFLSLPKLSPFSTMQKCFPKDSQTSGHQHIWVAKQYQEM